VKELLKLCLAPPVPGTFAVTELRVDPSLVSAEVDGEVVSISAPPIPAGIWAEVNVNASHLSQTLEHTWEEPLVPASVIRAGDPRKVDALISAFSDAVDEDKSLLLRWRGYELAAPADDDPWRGGPLPALPAPARRPPESVPKRFGASGIRVGDEDLVEVLVRAYAALADA
jgi:hypothetical protein